MRKGLRILALAGWLSWAAAAGNVYAQEAKQQPAGADTTQWQWGEVMSVDTAAQKLVLTYLDYDTDIEKQMTVMIDGATVFENVKSLQELKPQDTVSIDYVVNADGSNLAKLISLEKLDDQAAPDEEPLQPAPEKIESKPLVPDQNSNDTAGPG